MKLNQNKRPINSTSGFTLVEIMVSLGIFGVVMAGTMSFFMFGINFASYSQGKLAVNRDIRTFTNVMSKDATYANLFKIYSSFTDRTRATDGFSGDFLVLEYRDPDDRDSVSKVVGYYRHASDADGTGPVYSFTEEFDPPIDADILTLIPGTGTAGTHDQVIEISKGLSDGRLFYNFFSRSVMIKGEFRNLGSLAKDATNTYNFTISPRG